MNSFQVVIAIKAEELALFRSICSAHSDTKGCSATRGRRLT
jgi:hypothetical protein